MSKKWLKNAQEEIIRRLHQENRKLVHASVIILLSGLTVFLSIADLSDPRWWPYFWMWDKLKDVIAFSALYVLTTGVLKKSFLYILSFLVIRFLWEVAALIFGQNINNIIIVDMLFYLCLGIIITISSKDLILWN